MNMCSIDNVFSLSQKNSLKVSLSRAISIDVLLFECVCRENNRKRDVVLLEKVSNRQHKSAMYEEQQQKKEREAENESLGRRAAESYNNCV